MERKEAADYLGVSLRTLDRLCAAGKLTKGRALRKTRPVVVFNEHELKSLKDELQGSSSEEQVFRRLNTSGKGNVGFRIDPHYLQLLTTEGQRHGLSAGEYARKLVVQGLEDTRIQDFQDEVSLLREGLAHTFYTLLVMKLGVSEVEATEFVNSTIRRRKTC